jgi:hypothetical protein
MIDLILYCSHGKCVCVFACEGPEVDSDTVTCGAQVSPVYADPPPACLSGHFGSLTELSVYRS